jgi:hypothetical protein
MNSPQRCLKVQEPMDATGVRFDISGFRDWIAGTIAIADSRRGFANSVPVFSGGRRTVQGVRISAEITRAIHFERPSAVLFRRGKSGNDSEPFRIDRDDR